MLHESMKHLTVARHELHESIKNLPLAKHVLHESVQHPVFQDQGYRTTVAEI